MSIGSIGKKQSILGLIPLFKALEELGADPQEILKRRGMSLETMSGTAVIDQTQELEIISDAIEMCRDPLLGIKVGSQVSFTSYGTFAMLLMSAPDFESAVRVGAEFQDLSLLFSHMTLHFDKSWVELRYTLPESSAELRTFIADRDLMGTYSFVREFIVNPSEVLLGAGTARPKPEGRSLKEYNHYIDFDVKFDEPYNWFRLPRALLDMPVKHGNELAHQLYRVQAYELLRKFYSHEEDIVSQTKQIIEGYGGRFPSLSDVAKVFSLSERTFRRRLSSLGTTYQAILDEHKKQRCLGMIASGTTSVIDLADKLGYAESASFLRAFKRWTGLTPKAYLGSPNKAKFLRGD
jgi:AraC-like DNA-binding protein